MTAKGPSSGIMGHILRLQLQLLANSYWICWICGLRIEARWQLARSNRNRFLAPSGGRIPWRTITNWMKIVSIDHDLTDWQTNWLADITRGQFMKGKIRFLIAPPPSPSTTPKILRSPALVGNRNIFWKSRTATENPLSFAARGAIKTCWIVWNLIQLMLHTIDNNF